MMQIPLSPGMVRFSLGKRRGRADLILSEVAGASGFTVDQLKGDSRARRIVIARHYAMHRLSEETAMSTTQIGRVLGGKDHTSVIYGIRRWKEHWSKQA